VRAAVVVAGGAKIGPVDRGIRTRARETRDKGGPPGYVDPNSLIGGSARGPSENQAGRSVAMIQAQGADISWQPKPDVGLGKTQQMLGRRVPTCLCSTVE
jgi:hypothetical protein